MLIVMSHVVRSSLHFLRLANILTTHSFLPCKPTFFISIIVKAVRNAVIFKKLFYTGGPDWLAPQHPKGISQHEGEILQRLHVTSDIHTQGYDPKLTFPFIFGATL